MARVGRAFEMEVLAWSQNLTAERAAAVGATLAGSKDELLARADVVTIHLVLSERTRGLLGARELALMRPSAYLVNTSRGPIVDERGADRGPPGGRDRRARGSTSTTRSRSRRTTRSGGCRTP